MLRTSAPALLLKAITAVAIFPSLLGQTVQPQPKREHLQNAEVLYGWAQDSHGERRRTFTTCPNSATGKVPAIFFVGWLSCDSMEYVDAETHDGFGILLRRLIEQSGYTTVRTDKPGVGESQGDCSKADFNAELSGYQSAFDEMLKYDFIDPTKIFVVGLSNGGEHPEWKTRWYDTPEGHYGRPAAFYQQLQALNLGEAWQPVNQPVLVIRGTGDNIMSGADSETIARIVNQVHPGHARYLQIDDMTHGFTVPGKLCEELVPTIRPG